MNSGNSSGHRTLFELTQAIQAGASRPLLSLQEAIVQLDLVPSAQLQQLVAEDPHLLRDRSAELVQRGVLTADELCRALAWVAGVVEVDVKHFDVELPEHSAYLPARECRELSVVPLGMANETLFIASLNPTSESLHRSLCELTGHSVALVWASRTEIESRLNEGPEVPTLQWELTDWPAPKSDKH